jgi:hypothetical protein
MDPYFSLSNCSLTAGLVIVTVLVDVLDEGIPPISFTTLRSKKWTSLTGVL